MFFVKIFRYFFPLPTTGEKAYEAKEKIGDGGNAIIFKAIRKTDEKPFAIKKSKFIFDQLS